MKYNLYPSGNKPPLSRRTRKAIANTVMAFASPENKLTRAEAKMQADEHGKEHEADLNWHSKGSHKNPRRRSTLRLAFYKSVEEGYNLFICQVGMDKKPSISCFDLQGNKENPNGGD